MVLNVKCIEIYNKYYQWQIFYSIGMTKSFIFYRTIGVTLYISSPKGGHINSL